MDPAPFVLVVLALGAGIALDIGVRGGVHNGIVAVGVGFIVAALVTSRRVERAPARWLAITAMVPAGFLVVRASPWLAASNVAAVVALIALTVSFSRSGSVRDTTSVAVVRRAAAAVGRATIGLILLRQVVPTPGGRLARHGTRITRAAAIAVPILVVVIALLASADAVFKGMVVPHLHPQAIGGHAALIALFAIVALATGAAALGDAQPKARSGQFEALEIIVMLSLAVGVLALFAVAQLVALSDAGHRLVIEAGLTPAEYARSGFFQLCWATAFLVAFLAIVRGLASPGVYDRAAVRVLAGAVPLLAIGLVVVSLRRMALYDAAFGMTMLRLWVVGAAIWMGLLLAMFAMRNVGVGRTRSWLVAGAGTTAFALIMVANIANPEAFVVHHNITRAEHGHEFDPGYLSRLSDDAVPALVDAIDRSPSNVVRAALREAFSCPSRPIGPAALNIATIRATEARRQLCSERAASRG
ncbi:MAG: DUF4173 domain-containing protein [Actinomycetota bacterium]|nr:DUF4173 domain-containing protein [Actinomycetota bacterium]